MINKLKILLFTGLILQAAGCLGLQKLDEMVLQENVTPAIAQVVQTLPVKIAQARQAVAQNPNSPQKKAELMALLKNAALLNYLAQQQK